MSRARCTIRNGSLTSRDRRGRQMPGDEAQFVAVDIADAGHHPLIEQRLGQRPVRIRGQVRRRDVRIPVVAEQVGSEVSDGVHVVLALQDFQHSEVDARGLNVVRFQDDSDPVAGLARLADRRDRQLPSIFRCEWMLASPTRMNRCLPRLITSSTTWPVRSTVA